MTVAELTPTIAYLENGVTLAFPVHFRFLPHTLTAERVLADDTLIVLTEGADFAVTGGDTDAGGTLTLLASIAGATLHIGRDTPISQEMDYDTADTFPAESHEDALDKLTLILQEQKAGLGDLESRALRVPPGETIDELPPEAERAQGILGFDGDGDPIIIPTVDLGNITVTAQRREHIAAAGQTVFKTDVEYTVGYLGVYLNGVRLSEQEFTATDGIHAVLHEPAAAGDVVLLDGFLGADVDSDAKGMTFTQAGAGAETRTVEAKLRERVSAEDFGAVGDGVTDCTDAIWEAIRALRANPKTILDTIGGNNITAWSSGTVHFGRGVFVIQPNVLLITQDLGLILSGEGCRRMNNAVRAPTTLVVKGAGDANSFGIKQYRNGARGLTIRDMDVCYSDNTFLGAVVDTLDSPHLIIENAFVGTFGLALAERFTTAAACVRATYSEGITLDKSVFDGAKVGLWLDDVRSELGNTFGGSNTRVRDCWFYDFAVNHIYHGGTRTHEGMIIEGTSFNPIQVGPSSSCINIDNIDGFSMIASGFGASVSSAPGSQWMRATNISGRINGCSFLDLAPALVVGGQVDISNNRFLGPAGPTIQGGVITGSGNEFGGNGSGWLVSPTATLTFSIGPDLFKGGVTRSYDVPADSALFAGRIIYDRLNDASASKFRNTSSRISVQSLDGCGVDISTTPYAISILDTGRAIGAVGAAAVFNLPTAVPGTSFRIAKLTAAAFSLNCQPGNNFYGTGTGTPTQANMVAGNNGSLMLEARGGVGWQVRATIGPWTYA